jgi:hypothetical protein
VTVALKHHKTNSFWGTDGKRHASHKFNLNTPDDHLIDTNLGSYKLAGGIFDGPGKLQVNYTTPANYTVPGL